jgi:Arm DNA-binding domain/Phage integrase, N-terminal SAM-like domain
VISKLTKRTIDGISSIPAVIYDTELKGFGVRLGASGNLSWFVEYRPGAGGRRVAKKRVIIGSREFTPEQARHAAKAILATVALGGDPASAKKEERDAETFKEFAERYLEEEAELKLKPGTVANYRICVRKHTVPEIGSIKLNRVTTNDIARIHRKVGETRPMTANRIVECISSIFRYAASATSSQLGIILRKA